MKYIRGKPTKIFTTTVQSQPDSLDISAENNNSTKFENNKNNTNQPNIISSESPSNQNYTSCDFEAQETRNGCEGLICRGSIKQSDKSTQVNNIEECLNLHCCLEALRAIQVDKETQVSRISSDSDTDIECLETKRCIYKNNQNKALDNHKEDAQDNFKQEISPKYQEPVQSTQQKKCIGTQTYDAEIISIKPMIIVVTECNNPKCGENIKFPPSQTYHDVVEPSTPEQIPITCKEEVSVTPQKLSEDCDKKPNLQPIISDDNKVKESSEVQNGLEAKEDHFQQTISEDLEVKMRSNSKQRISKDSDENKECIAQKRCSADATNEKPVQETQPSCQAQEMTSEQQIPKDIEEDKNIKTIRGSTDSDLKLELPRTSSQESCHLEPRRTPSILKRKGKSTIASKELKKTASFEENIGKKEFTPLTSVPINLEDLEDRGVKQKLAKLSKTEFERPITSSKIPKLQKLKRQPSTESKSDFDDISEPEVLHTKHKYLRKKSSSPNSKRPISRQPSTESQDDLVYNSESEGSCSVKPRRIRKRASSGSIQKLNKLQSSVESKKGFEKMTESEECITSNKPKNMKKKISSGSLEKLTKRKLSTGSRSKFDDKSESERVSSDKSESLKRSKRAVSKSINVKRKSSITSKSEDTRTSDSEKKPKKFTKGRSSSTSLKNMEKRKSTTPKINSVQPTTDRKSSKSRDIKQRNSNSPIKEPSVRKVSGKQRDSSGRHTPISRKKLNKKITSDTESNSDTSTSDKIDSKYSKIKSELYPEKLKKDITCPTCVKYKEIDDNHRKSINGIVGKSCNFCDTTRRTSSREVQNGRKNLNTRCGNNGTNDLNPSCCYGSHRFMQEQTCMRKEIYECCLFHLLQNAFKNGHKNCECCPMYSLNNEIQDIGNCTEKSTEEHERNEFCPRYVLYSQIKRGENLKISSKDNNDNSLEQGKKGCCPNCSHYCKLNNEKRVSEQYPEKSSTDSPVLVVPENPSPDTNQVSPGIDLIDSQTTNQII